MAETEDEINDATIEEEDENCNGSENGVITSDMPNSQIMDSQESSKTRLATDADHDAKLTQGEAKSLVGEKSVYKDVQCLKLKAGDVIKCLDGEDTNDATIK